MDEEALKLLLPDGRSVSAIWTQVVGASLAFVYAPGAGSSLKDPFGAFAATELAGRGIASLRFQFPFSEAGRSAPDRTPVLESTWRAAIEAARPRSQRLIVGGRSMGGRIATQVVAAGAEVNALALFAYPLHAPAKPDQWRDGHLPSVTAPALFCSGTRDAFAKPEELRAVAETMPRATVHLLDGADHGFAIPKASGRTRQDVWAEATEALLDWLPA